MLELHEQVAMHGSIHELPCNVWAYTTAHGHMVTYGMQNRVVI